MSKLLKLFLCVCILNPFLLTACWNYKDIDELTIAAGLAIDKTSQGKYLVTIEIVNIEAKGQEGTMKSELIEVEGDSLFDAMRNAISVNSNKLYWPHAKIVIFSQEVAREGVVGFIDLFYRDTEPREKIHLFISKSETAKEIFDSKAIGGEIKSFEVEQMLIDQESLSKTLPVHLYEFGQELGGKGVSGKMSSICAIEIKGQKTIKLCGTAIFKEDKFVGFLDEDETKGLCFVLDKLKGGILVVKLGSENENITLEIHKNKTKIKPLYSDKNISIRIDTKTEVSIGTYSTKVDFFSEEGMAALKKTADEQLEAEIKNVIQKVQNDFSSDIFGFGNTVYREMPSLWKEKEKEWNTIFKDLKVSVNSNIKIRNTGLLSKPITAGD